MSALKAASEFNFFKYGYPGIRVYTSVPVCRPARTRAQSHFRRAPVLSMTCSQTCSSASRDRRWSCNSNLLKCCDSRPGQPRPLSPRAILSNLCKASQSKKLFSNTAMAGLSSSNCSLSTAGGRASAESGQSSPRESPPTTVKLPYSLTFTEFGDWSCYAPGPGIHVVRASQEEALQVLAQDLVELFQCCIEEGLPSPHIEPQTGSIGSYPGTLEVAVPVA